MVASLSIRSVVESPRLSSLSSQPMTKVANCTMSFEKLDSRSEVISCASPTSPISTPFSLTILGSVSEDQFILSLRKIQCRHVKWAVL
jgi:hypothetical protein